MSDSLEKLLSDLTSDCEESRCFAAEDLRDYPERRVVEALVRVIEDPAAGVRDCAIQSLVTIGNDDVISNCVELLSSESPLARNTACTILAQIGKAAIPALLPLLAPTNEDVRKFTIDILGEIRASESSDALIPLLEKSSSNITAAVSEALAKIGNTDAVPHLIAALPKGDSWVKCTITQSLGKLQSSVSVDCLIKLLRDADLMVVNTAINALGDALDTPEDVGYFLKNVVIKNDRVASTLLDAFSRILDRLNPVVYTQLIGPVILSPILDQLKSKSHPVRDKALALVSRMAAEGSKQEFLIDNLAAILMQGDDPKAAFKAALALGKVARDKARTVLHNYLQENKQANYPLIGVIESLGIIGDMHSSQLLQESAGRISDPAIQEVIQTAIKQISSRERRSA